MLRDITIGQYYQTDSVIHRLDPRVKLMGTLIFIITLFLGKSVWLYLGVTVFLAAVIKLSKVPVKFIVKGLKAVVILILFSVIFNLFLTEGTPVFHIWKLTVTKEGIYLAAFMMVRLIFLIMGSSLMTLTTTPTHLTDGLEKGLGFLKVFHVPVHEIAMMMSIALRFIPILVPLFISAFRRANELAMAMEARCYHGSEGRTKMKPLRYGKNDKIAYLVLAGYLIVMIGINTALGGRVI